MNSNNYNNDDYFRNTPQKEDVNKGWLNKPVTPSGQFGTQPSPTFGNAAPMPNLSYGTNSPSFGVQRASPAYPSASTSYGQQSTLYKPPSLNTFGSGSYFNKPMNSLTPTSTLTQSTPSSSLYPTSQTGIGMPIMSSSSSYASINSAPKQSWSMTSKGSKIAPYSQTRFSEDAGIFSYIVDITAMPDYSSKSVDEIRQEDYEHNLATSRTVPSTSLPTNSLYGSQPASMSQPSSIINSTTGSNIYTSPSMMSSSNNMPTSSLYSSSSSMMPQTQGSNSTPSSFLPIKSPLGMSPPSSSMGTFSASPQTMPGMTSSVAPAGSTLLQNSYNSSIMPSSFAPKPNESLIAPSITSSSMFSNPASSSFSTTMPNPGFMGNSAASFNPQVQTPQPQASNVTSGVTPGINITPTFSNTTSPQFNSTFSGSSFKPMSSFVQPSVSQSASSSFSSSLSNIDFDDPYLIKRMKFEKVEPTMPDIRRVLPKPIFNTRKETPLVNFKIRAPRPIPKSPVYTIPDLKDIDISQGINNLVIGFENKGRIEYLEPVKVSSIDEIQRKVMFRDEVVEISDPVGTGLNKKAKVYIEGFYPVCRVTNVPIKGKQSTFPQKGIQERFIYQLKTDKNRKFIDYNPENGLYIYEVSYFE